MNESRQREDTHGRPVFGWRSYGRFVEVYAVRTGWLVLWGRFADRGQRRLLAGNRIYTDPASVRRRIADSVLALTRRPTLATEALTLFDRTLASRDRGRTSPTPD